MLRHLAVHKGHDLATGAVQNRPEDVHAITVGDAVVDGPKPPQKTVGIILDQFQLENVSRGVGFVRPA